MCGPLSRCQDALNNPVRDITASRCRPSATCTRRKRSRSAGRLRCNSSATTSSTNSSTATSGDIGIVMQGGMYNTTLRAMEILGLADIYRQQPHPDLRSQRHLSAGRRRVRAVLRRQEGDHADRGGPAGISSSRPSTPSCGSADMQTRVEGKGVLPMAGEYTGGVLKAGVQKFSRPASARSARDRDAADAAQQDDLPRRRSQTLGRQGAGPAAVVLHRLPGAADLLRHEARSSAKLGPHARQRRYRLPPFSVLPPFNLGKPPWATASAAPARRRCRRQGGKRADRGRGRRRLLAQRPGLERRQRRSSTRPTA